MKKFLLLFVSLFLFTSCSVYSPDDFYGGEKLTPEKFDAISSEIAAAATTEFVPETYADGGIVCYFTDGGSVYHYNPKCSSIRNTAELISGTADEAIAAGKTKVCSRCGK